MNQRIPGCQPAWLALILAIATFTAGLPAQAQNSASPSTPSIFEGADLELGEKLIKESQCAACHQRKVGGDGSAIYQPMARLLSAGALRGMVEQCNMALNLSLFPDEVTAISAVLNRDHYRFK